VTSDLPRPRDWLIGATPYRTDAQAAETRLQSNEWTEPTPLGHYLNAADLDATAINRYPEIAASALRTLLAGRWSVEPEQVVVGNGSNEILLYTFLAFGGPDRTLLVFTPTYTMYGRLGRLTGMRVHEEPVGLPYALDAARVRETVARLRPDVVCFSSPNNPTGNLVGDETILAAAENGRILVVVDEAYAEFARHTVLPRIAERPNIVVARTLSKAHAAAGLRLGALVADRRLAAILDAARLPYNVGALTQLVASRVLADEAGLDARVACVIAERARVESELGRLNDVVVYPSAANFVLFRHRLVRAAALHGELRERRVLVRDVSTWPDAGEALRVTIGTPSDNDRFLAAVRGAVARGAA
jgi:histidinol-phosphate aminotransferase